MATLRDSDRRHRDTSSIDAGGRAWWPGCVRPSPRVALVSGFWGQNIGNAFFNVGGIWILEQLLPDLGIAFIQDQPGYRTFHDQSKGNPENDFVFLKELDIDYIVLQGPLLTNNYGKLWEETFRALTQRGTQIILMGAAFFKYTDEEKTAAKAFVERYPPVLISTRDPRTYEVVKDWGIPAYNGLDSAFFAPKVYAPLSAAKHDFITFNFDRFPEPTITVHPRGSAPIGANFEEFDHAWFLKTASVQQWWSMKGKAMAYVGHLLDRRKLPEEILGLRIVRPEHRSNPHMTYKVYQHKNAVASDEPYTYFTLYANTRLTLADRVHACVATLAYGNPAMLFTPSPRSALFERVGLPEIRNRPCRLDMDWLEEERQKQLAFCQDVLH